MASEEFIFRTVADIHSGSGKISELGALCKRYAIHRPLLVTDQGIIAAGLLDVCTSSLEAQQLDVTMFADVVADPPEQTVIDAHELANEAGCDGVIGYGGGSSMDVAKLIAVLLKNEQILGDMYGVDMIRSSRVPLIQIPTTAGTGSEVTSVAIVTTGEHTKAGVVSPVLFADAVVLDPELTLGLPPHVTAATGIDAMVHAIEAFTSKRLKNPLSDMAALRALQLMAKALPTAVHEGTNLQARSDMLLGAMLAGQAFANAPVGAVHALAYPLGGIYHIPHGLSNSLVLPHVLKFNSAAASGMYRELANAILPEEKHAEDAADRLAEYFLGLAKSCSLQTTLREMDIPEDQIETLATESMLQQRLLINNPREVLLDDARQIYQAAY
ncbi:MAG: iron-containing alcohol dehydrogenase [Pseudomonadota bacterium]